MYFEKGNWQVRHVDNWWMMTAQQPNDVNFKFRLLSEFMYRYKNIVFVVGYVIDWCLSITNHPLNREVGSIGTLVTLTSGLYCGLTILGLTGGVKTGPVIWRFYSIDFMLRYFFRNFDWVLKILDQIEGLKMFIT